MKKIMNTMDFNVRKEKGSITIFVLVGLLFMSAFLLISYAYNVNKSKTAKEQFNIISDIYSYKDGDANAYERAYTALRKKNKQTMTASVENTSILELTKTYEDKVSNYRIYGTSEGVGNLVTDSSSSNFEKYEIPVKISEENAESITINIYLSSILKDEEYIDFKLQKVIRSDRTEEYVDLPELQAYEDYTKIEVITENTPSRIELEYIGYTLD